MIKMRYQLEPRYRRYVQEYGQESLEMNMVKQ